MDTSQYMAMFLEESMDNLQTLNESLLQLEQEPDDIDKLNEIFRVAHTIKGMAATMGFTEMAELTHKMEDVLSNFREGDLKVTQDVVTVLFKCLDTLEQMVNNISEEVDEKIPIDHIMEELEQASKGEMDLEEEKIESKEAINQEGCSIPLNEYDLNVIEQAHDKGFDSYKIKILLSENTILKSSRAFLIFKNLEEHGEIIKSLPGTEDIENENFDFEIDLIYITTKTKEEIHDIIINISEVEKVIVDNVYVETKKEEEIESKEIISEEKSNMPLDEYDLNLIKQAQDKGFYSHKIKILLSENTLLKSARVFLIFKSLEEYGEIIKCNPCAEDIENENFDFEIELIYITTKTKEEIYDIIINISEVDKVVIDNVNVQIKRKEKMEDAQVNEKVKDKINNIQKKKVEEDKIKVPKKLKDKENNHKKAHQSVRVDLERLDKFMNMVSELVIHRTRLEQISTNYKLIDLNETLEQVARTTSDLQDLVMKIRMLPLDIVFNRFPRMVRDLSVELDKEMELILQGSDTELDRTVIEEIGEPLIHLIRNAADHGIESKEKRARSGKDPVGKIKLIAYQEGTKAVIKVEDDGGGVPVDKIKAKAERLGINTEGMSDNDIKNLIFGQGFSTNEEVTDISGRGVGMDVVKTKITALGGTVDLISEEGKGSCFIIRLPLTLQIIQALLVEVGSETMAISLGYIDRVIDYKEDIIKKTNNKEVIIYRGNVIPFVRLNEKLDLEEAENEKKYIVIVKAGEKTAGLLVDGFLGQKEIVIKPFGKTLHGLREYIGATILGDGLVTLILDVAALV